MGITASRAVLSLFACYLAAPGTTHGFISISSHGEIPQLLTEQKSAYPGDPYPLKNGITIPGFPNKKKWNSTGFVPALPLYRDRDSRVMVQTDEPTDRQVSVTLNCIDRL